MLALPAVVIFNLLSSQWEAGFISFYRSFLWLQGVEITYVHRAPPAPSQRARKQRKKKKGDKTHDPRCTRSPRRFSFGTHGASAIKTSAGRTEGAAVRFKALVLQSALVGAPASDTAFAGRRSGRRPARHDGAPEVPALEEPRRALVKGLAAHADRGGVRPHD